MAASASARKFVDKVPLWEPNRAPAPLGAQDLSPRREPWVGQPSPRLRRRSPARAGEGRGDREAALNPRLAPWSKLWRSFRAEFSNEPLSQHTGSSRKWFYSGFAGPVLVLLSFCFFFVAPCLCVDLLPLDLQYFVRLPRPTTHIMDVEIDVGKVQEPALDFVMPAWAPGRYAIYDFAKNVQEFEATGLQNQALPWTKVDKQTWHVTTGGAGARVRVRYRVYGNDLTGSFSQLDASHANLNGASVYMYVDGHKQDPLTLTVEGPSDWKLISGFSDSTEQHTFSVPTYDVLVDTPMELSAECSLEQFQEHDKTFRIAVHNYAQEQNESRPPAAPSTLNTLDPAAGQVQSNENPNPKVAAQSSAMPKLVEGVKKIVNAEMEMMPAPDFQSYTFIFHFAPDISAGDGMEHLNSTEIMVRGELSDSTLAEALSDAAHEFFHTWNVKRLRPAVLGPFDYTRENYTNSLWFAEGVTSYYTDLTLLRSGIWSEEQFLTALAGEIETLETEPGRLMMSAESSSFHAWFYDRSPQMQQTNFANATISYYNKGLLLGMLLDLEIRARTAGRKSLDDVLRLMYHRFYEAAPTSYYGSGCGYEEKDILEAVSAVASTDFASFFERYVRGTQALAYNSTLAVAGLELRTATTAAAPPDLGALTESVAAGVRVLAVRAGGAADRAGLGPDDLLVAVDGLSLATEELATRLKMYPPGSEIPFTVQRHGQRQRITVKLDPPLATEYSIEELAGATLEQVDIRNGWLGKTVAGNQ
jgi:predicted metalloprotease with PDZ domain